ncbi:MAG: hypothetical protein N7Q72_06640, partial [Spiroplasma sp. Tabriz.8]|nr:hypothetical protein [Spiroplasma sp. Tabriz.8]
YYCNRFPLQTKHYNSNNDYDYCHDINVYLFIYLFIYFLVKKCFNWEAAAHNILNYQLMQYN